MTTTTRTPAITSLGIEPFEVLGFDSDEELENALIELMQERELDKD